MGRYGQKTGAGWYKYDAPGSRNRIAGSADRPARGGSGRASAASRAAPIADEEIVARITTALANEGARVLEDGFATRAGDIDIIYCLRLRLPAPSRRTDVLCRHGRASTTVLARVNEYRARFGDYWEPAPLLERLVAEGRVSTEAA